MPNLRPPVASLSQTQQRKNLKQARSRLSARGGRDEAGKLIPIDLKVGDKVLFGKWSGTEVKLDGVELMIMKESDIMGVLEGSSEARAGKKAA